MDYIGCMNILGKRKAWNSRKIIELLNMRGVRRVKSHMCAFGILSEDKDEDAKLTALLSKNHGSAPGDKAVRSRTRGGKTPLGKFDRL